MAWPKKGNKSLDIQCLMLAATISTYVAFDGKMSEGFCGKYL